jgi:hypothetical protein
MSRIKVFQDGDWTKDACAYYRTYLPATELIKQGADIVTTDKTESVLWADDFGIDEKGESVRDPRVQGWADPDCDVAVFQRPLHRDVVDLIVWCKANGVKTVLDMDDDYFKVDPANKAAQYMRPETSPRRNTEHLKRAIAAADLITVTTAALAKRYAPHKARIIPNFIPRVWTSQPLRPLPTDVTVGWTGTTQTHPGDLESTKGGVARAVLTTGAHFRAVGDGEGVQEALGLSSLTPYSVSGWVPLPHYPDKMNELDIGIVPLRSSAFNHGKSWLKGLEFSALGIPFVASATQPYVQLNRESKLGRIARTPQDWAREVQELVENEAMRENEGERAREIVRERHLLEDNAGLWLDAWLSVLA